MKRFRDWELPEFDSGGWAYKTKTIARMYGNKKEDFVEYKYHNPYGWRCQNPGKLKIGKNVDIGCFSYLNAKFGIDIEKKVQVGSGVKIYSQDTISNTKGKVILRENCKIGSNSVILPSTIIGKDSIIGHALLFCMELKSQIMKFGQDVQLKK